MSKEDIWASSHDCLICRMPKAEQKSLSKRWQISSLDSLSWLLLCAVTLAISSRSLKPTTENAGTEKHTSALHDHLKKYEILYIFQFKLLIPSIFKHQKPIFFTCIVWQHVLWVSSSGSLILASQNKANIPPRSTEFRLRRLDISWCSPKSHKSKIASPERRVNSNANAPVAFLQLLNTC